MILALAGHVDHGKTSLVKALTGTNTDRLPQEQRRGMTLDLGFAHLDFDDCESISLIDVPGHEHFIHNMLAGVSGIDAALLVVAADDGVMPQTIEHLQILDLLGVGRGAVALTKTDAVSAEHASRAETSLREVLAPTTLRDAPIFPVSSVTREGLTTLVTWLHNEATRKPLGSDPTHFFRLPIDRAFTLAGSGTIVTGTVHSGQVRAGDVLTLSPRVRRARVRGVQIHGRAVESATAGQRCALNLADTTVQEASRGQWIVSEAIHSTTTRFDARIRVLATEAHPMQHWTPVHLHHGTTDVLARIAIPGEGQIAPGSSGLAQVILQEPAHALHADRFILRDTSAQRTLGGGIVLNPFAPKRRHWREQASALRQIFERDSASGILTGLLQQGDGGIDLQQFAHALNLTPDGMAAVLRDTRAVALGHTAIGLSPGRAEDLTVRALAALRTYHCARPQATGMPLDELRAQVAPHLPGAAFRAFVRTLADHGHLVLSNDMLSLHEHDATATTQDEALWELVRTALLDAGVHSPLLSTLAAQLGLKDQPLRDFLYRKSRSGAVRRITPSRFCLRETLAELAEIAHTIGQSKPDGMFTASEFRDAIGTGRGLAIHYLEFFDQVGITRRSGDQRHMTEHYSEPLKASVPEKRLTQATTDRITDTTQAPYDNH